MKNKKLIAIPLLIAIALSAFGFVYARWMDTIYIEGTAEMGSLTLVWDEDTRLVWVDNEDWNGDGKIELPEKDIGYAAFYYDTGSYLVDPHTGKGGYKNIIIEVHDAYAQYEVDFTTLVVNNTGTIPAHFVDIIITGYDETDEEDLMFVWVSGYEYEIGYFLDNGPDDTWGTADDVIIIYIYIVNFVCNQLDPCHVTKGEIDLEFTQECEECHTYTFDFELVGVQWNKVAEYQD